MRRGRSAHCAVLGSRGAVLGSEFSDFPEVPDIPDVPEVPDFPESTLAVLRRSRPLATCHLWGAAPNPATCHPHTLPLYMLRRGGRGSSEPQAIAPRAPPPPRVVRGKTTLAFLRRSRLLGTRN